MLFDEMNPLYMAMAKELVPALKDSAGQVLQAEFTLESDDPAAIAEDFAPAGEYPMIRLTLESTSKGTYQHQFVMEKALAGHIFGWMVGEDPPAEITEEHFDAVKEVVNQMLGQIQAAFDGEEFAFKAGEVTIEEIASGDDLTLPEDGTVAVYRFKRGEEEAEYTVTHIVQGELAAAAESDAKEEGQANEKAEVEAEVEAEGDGSGISEELAAELTGDLTESDDAPGDGDFDDLLSGGEMVQASAAEFDEFSDSAGVGVADNKLDMLLDVNLDITVELGRKVMNVEEILRMGKGSVIELNKLAGEPVDILVNGKKLAEGEVVVIEDHFGVRLTHLINPRERIRSLGK